MACPEHRDLNAKLWLAAIMLFMAGLITVINYSGGCSVQKRETKEAVLGFPSEDPPPLSNPSGDFIPLDWTEQMMVDHALGLPAEADRLAAFYFDACNLANQGADMDMVEQGINKGINLLSKSANLVRVTKLKDESKYPGVACVFAADQLDYRISNREYREVIEKNLQLQFETQTVRGQQLKALTQKKKPYVFAEDFFLTLFEADAIASKKCAVYCDITDQPLGIAEFFNVLGVNVQKEFDDSRAVLAAFNTSQIAFKKDRLVQVIETADGWCMSTEDSSLANQESFQNTPFPKEAAIIKGVQLSNRIFVPQAQEHICTKKNKLQGIFRLNGGDFNAADAAPNDVVGQPDFAQVDPTIRLGDCSNCHHGSPGNPFTDQAGSFIAANTNFSPDEKNLGKVFFKASKMQKALQAINDMERESYAKLGITATVDPLNTALIRVLRSAQSAEQVAGYASMPVPEFLEALRAAPLSSQNLGNLLNGGTVSVGTLKDAFPTLVLELRLYDDPEL